MILAFLAIGLAAVYLAGLYIDIYFPEYYIESDADVADTCRLVAAMRALDSMRNCIFEDQDPLAQFLAGESHMEQIKAESEHINPTPRDLNPLTMRTIAIDERIFESTSWKGDGVNYPASIQQVVMIGAGMDSRPYRLYLPTVHWFEVDMPEVIALKKRILSSVPVDMKHIVEASNLKSHSYIEMNLKLQLDQLLPNLVEKGFDPTAPALFVAEGLFMYLTVTDVRRLLSALPQVRGSKVVASVVTATARKALTNPIIAGALDLLNVTKSHKIAALWKNDALSLRWGNAYHPWRLDYEVNIGLESLKKSGISLPKFKAFWLPHVKRAGENIVELLV